MPFGCPTSVRSLLATGLIAAALISTSCKQAEPAAGGPPAKGGPGGKKGGGEVPVMVAKAVDREVPLEIEVIGNVEASSTVMIKPQVSGELVKVLFKEGDFVAAGAPLFEIDRRSLEAQLAQAQANLQRAEALSRQAQANAGKSRATLQYLKDQSARYSRLNAEGVVSKEQNEQVQSNAKVQQEAVAADTSMIESSRAEIQAQRALIDNLKVQLGFTQIKSPISGRTGTLLIKAGNIVSANSTELLQINQLQPVFVSFAIPESQLSMVGNRFGKSKIPVFAVPQDGGATTEGLLTFYENTVDPSTGTIRLRATFPNPDRKLWPGSFLRVRMQLGTIPNAVVVPNQAVQTGQDGQFVFVVKEDRSVEMRTVTTATRSAQDMVISKGLAPGETVVTEGQMRLAPGMKVVVRDGRPAGKGAKGGGKGPGGEGGGPAPDAAPAENGGGEKGPGGKGGRGEGGRGDGMKKGAPPAAKS
ncbi:MAG: efflux RND transporter periplasmic adaptor subunit [Acidobacteria bacterium]|nr:efflux RND transporter periplasmic adaptor subunit [Acidobacteriota bacterium]